MHQRYWDSHPHCRQTKMMLPKAKNKLWKQLINPIRAEIFSHPSGAGGGSYMTPPLSPDIAVIEKKNKKQMIKL